MSTPGQRYQDQIHRMQSAIRWTITKAISRGLNPDLDGIVTDTHSASPKHLRVGVESAMAATEAVVNLLYKKGIITQEEYSKQLIEEVTVRADSWEAKARDEGLPPNTRFM